LVSAQIILQSFVIAGLFVFLFFNLCVGLCISEEKKAAGSGRESEGAGGQEKGRPVTASQGQDWQGGNSKQQFML
jgi:hypothetical protein